MTFSDIFSFLQVKITDLLMELFNLNYLLTGRKGSEVNSSNIDSLSHCREEIIGRISFPVLKIYDFEISSIKPGAIPDCSFDCSNIFLNS